jgi:hypothetical protein
VALIVKSYLMYDHIPARLYRNILVETDGRKYGLRILEGELSGSQPYVHLERNRHSRLYAGENKAREAAEMLFRTFESVAGMFSVQHFLGKLPSDAQNHRHAEELTTYSGQPLRSTFQSMPRGSTRGIGGAAETSQACTRTSIEVGQAKLSNAELCAVARLRQGTRQVNKRNRL